LQHTSRAKNQLREKATAVLGAASIVVPVAAVGDGPAGTAIPLALAVLAYVFIVRECGAALVPRNVHAGLMGAELLRPPRTPMPISVRCRPPRRRTPTRVIAIPEILVLATTGDTNAQR
jgi:hypothetical protein